MSNPQDSPKTARDLLQALASRAKVHPEPDGRVYFREKDVEFLQSYIDAQKAEVPEEVESFIPRLREALQPTLVEGEWVVNVNVVAQLISTRDQKLVQEAVKPWRDALHRLLSNSEIYDGCDPENERAYEQAQQELWNAQRQARAVIHEDSKRRALLSSQPTAPLMEGDSVVKPFIAALVWALPHLEDQATNWENEYVYDSPDDTGRLGDAAEYALNKLSATRRLLLNYAVPLAVADIPLETRPFVIVEGDPSDPSRSTVQVIFTDPDALLSQPQEVK